ncbi:MAG TPA: DinB family protein [Micromonosporaceae bacterium]|jgi:uncharacterized damage-inducible protein DinB
MEIERADLLQSLRRHREFLRFTTRDLTDEQAGQCTTVSALCLGGLIKHTASVEAAWMRFAVGGAEAMVDDSGRDRDSEFAMLDGETLAGVLEDYARVAARTDEQVETLDLDAAHRLPVAPWFAEEDWTVRRALLHIIAETSQHAGHADIIREALDGSRTMG